MAGKRWIPTYNVTPRLTRASRWRSPPSYRRRRRAIDYTNLHGGTDVRILIYFLKNYFQKNFLAPFQGPPGLKTLILESPSRATYPRIFPHLSTPILASRKRWIPPPKSPLYQNLLRHLHVIVYIAQSPAFTIYSFFQKKYFKIFGALSEGPRGSGPIFEFPFSRYVP